MIKKFRSNGYDFIHSEYTICIGQKTLSYLNNMSIKNKILCPQFFNLKSLKKPVETQQIGLGNFWVIIEYI